GQVRVDGRAFGDRIVKGGGGRLEADRLPGLELDVAGPPGRSKAEARSDTEETCRGAVVAFDLLRFLTLLGVEEGVAPAKPGLADDGRLGRADALPRHGNRSAREQLQGCKRRIHGLRRDQYEPLCLREGCGTARRQDG